MTYKHIAFPVLLDGAPNSATSDLERLARQFGARVTLLNVFQPSTSLADTEAYYGNPDAFFDAYQQAHRFLQSFPVDLPPARVDRVLLSGDTATEIADFVETHEVDLVVLPPHFGVAAVDVFLGSVAARLMHDSHCDLWFSGHMGDGPHRILCSMNLTEEAVPLLKFTDELAHALDAEVSVLHSVPTAEIPLPEFWDPALKSSTIDDVARQIAHVQADAQTDFPVHVSLYGVSDSLEDAEKETRPDLIVIGRGKSQSRFGRLWTHAYSIVRHAECPVLSHCSRKPVSIRAEKKASEYVAHVMPV